MDTVLQPPTPRLALSPAYRTRHFGAVAFCGYLAMLCLAITVTALFLADRHMAAAIAAAGLFGLTLAATAGAAMYHIQRRELRYVHIATPRTAAENYSRVLSLAAERGWQVLTSRPPLLLRARTPDSMLQAGEQVVVEFEDSAVLVASICDPSVGYSLVGSRRCREHRESVQRAVA